MASTKEVRGYLGYWFQLGKGVIFPKTDQRVLPEPIFVGHNYSPSFEACWQTIVNSAQDCYLEGTEQSIRELLEPEWELVPCCRCTLPVPVSNSQTPSCLCPCVDLELWPDFDLPLPRLPLNSLRCLHSIQSRLISQGELDEGVEACLLPAFPFRKRQTA